MGVTGVDKIWPEENTDDEDTSKDPRTSPPHTRRGLQARRARQRVRRCIDKICAGLSPGHLNKHLSLLEELGGPAAESYHGAAQSFINWADNHDLALVEDGDIDRALCSFYDQLFFGSKNELGGRPFDSGVDVSGPLIFSHGHVLHPAIALFCAHGLE